jgi:hypothetical protein
MNPKRNLPEPRGIEWVLSRNGVEKRRIPFEPGTSPVFDVSPHNPSAYDRVSLSLGAEPLPHDWVRVTVEFTPHTSVPISRAR